MKNLIVLLLLFSVKFVGAQPGKVIDHLDFPYNKNYDLHLKGQITTFDQQTGKMLRRMNSEIIYHIDKQEVSEKGNLTNFQVVQVAGTDSTKALTSPLMLDDKGMCWWLGSSVKTKGDKHKTQAILLPLTRGKKWKGYFNDIKTNFTCITTDTTISTSCGNIQAFGIGYKAPLNKTKDYTVMLVVREFYNQQIGKVALSFTTYLVILKSGKSIMVNQEYEEVVYYSGYKKQN